MEETSLLTKNEDFTSVKENITENISFENISKSNEFHTKNEFRGDIEGLRGIAVLLILFYHAEFAFCKSGFVGVDIFFVISGYVVTMSLEKEFLETKSIDILQFYAKRIVRIVPASSFIVVLSTIIGYFMLELPSFRRFADDIVSCATFWSNVHFCDTTGYWQRDIDPSPLLHFWSLSIEMQFYIIWPIFVLFTCRTLNKKFKIILFLTVALGSYLYFYNLSHYSSNHAYFYLFSRIWELVLGGIIFEMQIYSSEFPYMIQNVLSATGLLFLITSALFKDVIFSYPSQLAVLGTILIIICNNSFVNKMLLSSFLRWIGVRSFSIYLVHWPLLIFFALFVNLAPYRVTIDVAILNIFSSLTICSIMNEFLEKMPVALYSKSKTASFTIGILLIFTCLFCSAIALYFNPIFTDGITIVSVPSSSNFFLGNVSKNMHKKIDEIENLQKMLQLAVLIESVPSNLVPRLSDRVTEDKSLLPCIETKLDRAGCVFGNLKSDHSIALVGDSHAAHWTKTLEYVSNKLGIKLFLFWKNTCPAVSSHGYGLAQNCNDYREFTKTYLLRLKPLAVFISQADGLYYTRGEVGAFDKYISNCEKYYSSYYSFVTETLNSKLVIIGDVPRREFSVPDTLAKKPNFVHKECTKNRISVLDSLVTWHNFEKSIATKLGAYYISGTEFFCTEKNCVCIVGNIMTYWDASHMSSPYAEYIAPAFYQTLLRTGFSVVKG